jgi:hypothetical protein
LVYCASTLSWGGACSAGAPLPLVMKLSPEALPSGDVCRLNSLDRWEMSFPAEWLS